MKKIITALFAAAIALSASARLNGDGYYRVQNYNSLRYVYVLDDKGELNFQAQTAELNAIQLWKGYEKAITDPSTVIYIKDLTGKKQDFDLQTQGTGVNAIIDYPVSIRQVSNPKDTYMIFGRNSGMTRYIGDGTTDLSLDRGYPTSLDNGNTHRWYIHPMTTSDDSNYFGIEPDLQSGAEHYTTIYAGFPFSFHSPGMTAYYVSGIGNGTAFIKEITGVVPQGTPVIIKCSSKLPTNNRLNIGGTGTPVSNNKLKGVYFNNSSILHKNQTPNDKATMRVLGRLSDGSIGFVTSDEEFLARNKAYLVVPAGTPAELKIELATSTAITDIAADANEAKIRVNGLYVYVEGAETAEIYGLTGQLVARGNGSGRLSLPAPGIYIVKAGTTVRKIIAR